MKLLLPYPVELPFTITQKFAENANPFYAGIGAKGHGGMDLAVPENTPMYATHDGTVIFAGLDQYRGLGIEIVTSQEYDYKDGTTCLYKTQYWHGNKAVVTVGDVVKKGDLIGYSGNTGQSTGPHVHFGIKPVVKSGLGYSNIEQNNGYFGNIDIALFLDGTYPVNKVYEAYIEMQKAILKYQILNNITIFVGKPLNEVQFGPGTRKSANKYQSNNSKYN